MSLEEENQLLRASLDKISKRLHEVEIERDVYLKQAVVEYRASEYLRKEVTRHNKRCRGRRKQVKLLLEKLNEARQRLKSCAAGFCESTGL